jgi:hypothetical protein
MTRNFLIHLKGNLRSLDGFGDFTPVFLGPFNHPKLSTPRRRANTLTKTPHLLSVKQIHA